MTCKGIQGFYHRMLPWRDTKSSMSERPRNKTSCHCLDPLRFQSMNCPMVLASWIQSSRRWSFVTVANGLISAHVDCKPQAFRKSSTSQEACRSALRFRLVAKPLSLDFLIPAKRINAHSIHRLDSDLSLGNLIKLPPGELFVSHQKLLARSSFHRSNGACPAWRSTESGVWFARGKPATVLGSSCHYRLLDHQSLLS